MEATLNRTIIDKLGAAILFVIVVLLFGKDFGDYTIVGKSIWVVASAALFINVIFILSTPIAKIKDSTLSLYSEVQPIVFALKPQIVDLKDLNNLEIRKGFIEFRAIFSMSHGSKAYHGFPAASEKRVERFMNFLIKNTESEVIKMAYNKSSKPTPKGGAA